MTLKWIAQTLETGSEAYLANSLRKCAVVRDRPLFRQDRESELM
jgi:hypothetical protein